MGEIYYNKALKINPNCAPCIKNIGRIYEKKNDFSKALLLYDKAILMDATDATLYSARGSLKEK